MKEKVNDMGERIVRIETEIKNITKGMDENKTDHKILFDKIDDFVESADRKYVSKPMLTFTLSVIMVILAILTFVFANRGG